MQFSDLISVVQDLDDALRRRAAQAVNVALTSRNWLIGAWIVEFEQNGEDRAKYGDRLIPEIARAASVKGLSATNLRLCRQFYSSYPRIGQALTDEFKDGFGIDIPFVAVGDRIHQSVTDESREVFVKSEVSDSEFAVEPARILTQLSFTHIVELLKIDDPLKRYQLQLPDAEELRAFVRKDYEKIAGSMNSEG